MRWILCALLLVVGCGRPDVAALRAQLASADWRTSIYAVQTLQPAELAPGDRARMRALARGAESSLLRVSATFALGAARDRESLAQLAEQLRGGEASEPDEDWSVRRAAALALGMLGDPAAIEPLLEGLDDEDREVRESAESALTKLVSRSSVVARLRTETTDPDPLVRMLAASRLAELGVVGAASRLAALLVEDREPLVRVAAAHALGVLDRDPSAEQLLRALHDADPQVRAAAADLAERGASAQVRTQLRELVGDPDEAVRLAGAAALRRVEGLPGCERFYADGISILAVEDEVTLEDDGQAQLVRTWTVSVGGAVAQTDSFHLLLPARVRRVTEASAQDAAVPWREERDGDLPEVVLLDVPTRGGEQRRLRIRAQLAPGFEWELGGARRFVYRADPLGAAPQRSLLSMRVPGDRDRVAASPAPDRSGALLTWSPQPAEVSVRLPQGGARSGALVRGNAPFARDWLLALLVAVLVGLGVGWVIRRAWKRAAPGDDDRILIALALALAALLLTPHLVEDNLQYVAYARSMVLDGDLHILDEYYQRNTDAIYAPDPRVPYGPVGAAVFWVPALALAHGVNGAARALGLGAVPDGMSLPYLVGMQLCAAFLVACAWLMAYRMARRRWSRRAALLGVAGIALGTNALMFQFMWTGSSHAPSLFLTTAVLYLLDRPQRAIQHWVLCGVCAGLAVITRSQNLALLPIVLLVWGKDAYQRGSAALPRSFVAGLAFVGGMLVGYLPQALVSFSLDGSLLSDPYGVGHGRFTVGLHRLWPLLIGGRPDTPFSPTGVLTTMPLLVVAALGLVRLTRRQPFTGTTWLLVVLGQLAAVISYAVWWGRMFLATSYLINLFAIGAVGLAGAVEALETRFPRARGVLLTALGLGCLPNLRAILLEAAWRQTSLPEQTPFWRYLHGAVFLPDASIHATFIERRGNLAWPVRCVVEALRALDFVELALWSLAFVALLALGWWLAGVLQRAQRAGRAALAALALLVPLALGFALLGGGVGARTDLEFCYVFHSAKRGDCEVRPVLLATAGKTGELQVDSDLVMTRLDLVTFGRDLLDLPGGAPVARVSVDLADGRRLTRDLRAGIETADAEVDNPDRSARHGLGSSPVQHRYVRDDATRTYPAHAFLTSFEIAPAAAVTRVAVEQTADHGELWVTQLLAVQPAPAPGWRASRSSRWMAYR